MHLITEYFSSSLSFFSLFLARIHGIDMDSWCRHGLMIKTWTHAFNH